MTPDLPSLAAQGLAVDLTAEPWRYPGPPAAGPGVLLAGGFVHAPDDVPDDALEDALAAVLAAAGAPPLAGRHAVAAVGSNAAPSVLGAKLRRAGADPVVPMVPGVLEGVAVAHSAHVSRAGYVAAAPYRAPGRRTAVVVALLSEAQVRCLDATEPNYARRPVEVAGTAAGGAAPGPGATVAVRTSAERHGAPVPACAVYVSRRGVLTAPDGGVVPLGPQPRVWAVLRSAGALPGGLPDDHRRLAAALAADPRLRARVRAALLRQGLVRDAGLDRPA